MPMFRSRRVPDEADVRIARARVARLASQRMRSPVPARRDGWVPQVPPSVVDSEQTPRVDPEDADLEAAVRRYWNATHTVRPSTRRPGRHRARDVSLDHDEPDLDEPDLDAPAFDEPAVDEPGFGEPAVDEPDDRIRVAAERLGIGRPHLVAVSLALLVGLLVTGVMALAARPHVQPVDAEVVATGTPLPDNDTAGVTGVPGAADPPADAPDDPGSTGPSGEVVVHVDGRVVTPGVVTLPAGARVIDAIEAAGGAEAGVDLTPLNLARVLADGEQVLVGVDPPPGAGADNGSASAGGAAPDGTINLNTATADDLEELPGIGPTLAQRILDWRAEHGRFSTVDELREVSGIGERTLADLEALVTV